MEKIFAEETNLNMMLLMFLTTTTVCVIAYFIFKEKILGRSNLPPGPFRISILGNLLQIVKDPHLKLSKWAQCYGNLYTIYMGTKPALVVSEPKLMKEIFGTTASTGKFKTAPSLLLSQGSYGILNTEDKAWVEQRQFCFRSLKEFGFGDGRSMEPLILSEVKDVCDWIRGTSEIVQLHEVLLQSTINILWTIASGERFKLGDSEISRLMNQFNVSLQYIMNTGLAFFPSLKHLAPRLSGYLDYDLACKNIHTFIENKFHQHEATYVEGQRRDLMDMYIEHLKYMEKSNSTDSGFFGELGWKNSVSSIVELFVGGGETTSATINWALFYLAQDQNLQAKLHNEIDDVIGRDKDPSLDDRVRMPFTEAVILETLRLSSVMPFGVMHELLEDIHFHNYTLPKGMILMGNMYHIHHNPEIWEDPENFRPERFLLEDGGETLKEFLVPFQTGKRRCLGERLALDLIFLFLTKIFQQFNVTPDKRFSKKEYFTPDVRFMLSPKQLGLVMSAR